MWCRKRDPEAESFKRMRDSYLALQMMNPDDERVGLAAYDPEKDEFTYSDEFNERFLKNNRRGYVGMHLRYKMALDKAAREYNSMLLDAAMRF
jgi:hypothetical protein